MTDEAALVRAILGAPDDDAPRLVYADWLEEHGRPERAEFIRVQIELARGPVSGRWELENRQNQLLAEHRASWLTSLEILGEEVTFRRGFVERIRIRTDAFLRHGPRLFQMAPIREVHLDAATGRVGEIAACPWLARLSGLSLEGNELIEEDAAALAASPHVANLTLLDLTTFNDYSDCTHGVGDDGLSALAASRYLEQLRTLRLGGNAVGERGVMALANSSSLTGLKELALSGPCNWLTARAAAAMAASPALAGLEVLELARCGVDDDELCALAGAAFMKTLRVLYLEENSFTGRGAVALLQSEYVARTRDLDLATNAAVGDAGLQMLAACPALARVDSLNLAQCGVTDDGLLALLRSPYLPQLRALDLSGGLSPDFAMGLAPDDPGPSLTDAGARGLAECAPLGAVCQLILYDNPRITEAGRELLRGRFGDRVRWD